MQKSLLFIGLILTVSFATAQIRNLERAEEAIADSFYERAYKLTSEALEDEVTKKDPLTYYLHAISTYHLSGEKFFLKRNPEPIKDACKLILKAKRKDKDNRYEGVYDEIINSIVEANNALALEQYQVNKFSKSIKIYSLSVELNNDTTAMYMIGRSYQMDADTVNAKIHYKALVNGYYEDAKAGKELANPYVEPFLFLTDCHWFKKEYDSAQYYLDLATSIFGEKHPRINFYQYSLAKDQIADQPPSSLMMNVIQKALKYSPTDTFLIKKENALAMYLIRNAVGAGGGAETDSMIMRFARRKASKAMDPVFENLKELDIFLQPYPENVIWKISDYFYTNTHDAAAAYCAKLYILKTSVASDTIKPTEKDIVDRWIKILDFTSKNETSGFSALLLNQALMDYPKSKALLDVKKKLLKK
ncbi:MAG: hypothetical protein H6605_00435 [Flavobacteriales bacterium]|nr:hypothetical protein [Flavobacteriales bacterium]